MWSRIIGMIIMSSFLVFAKIPADTKQLLVVSTASWSADSGVLQRYTKKSSRWTKVGKQIAVKVGKNGLAWGIGLHKTPKNSRYIKREGDGKAPAGIFRLSYAFGDRSFGISFPYHRMSTKHHCVDDSRSKYYNRVIDSSRVKKDYHSFERMKFASGLYSYGLFVDHNPKQVQKAGSCIFLHIRKSNGKATVGCTAMRKNEIKTVLKWLNPKKKPLLVQAPKKQISKLFK